MRWLAIVCAGLLSVSSPIRAMAEEEVSCVCEESSCKACEVETNLTFYTSKCGPNNSRVKSCKKPTCVPVDNMKQCIADLERDSKAVENVAKKDSRTNAPIVALNPVGSVTNSEGNAKVIRASGTQEVASNNLEVYEGDTVLTESGGKVRVQMKDKNVINVASESRVVIEQQQNDMASGKHKTMLNLMYGKLRAQVAKSNKYDGKENTFNVKTKAAVAGVRGTDFVTSFTPGSKTWSTEIHTFEGKVEFGGDTLQQKVTVAGGQKANFSITSPPDGEITDVQLKSFIEKGVLSDPTAMKDDEIQKLDIATDFKAAQSAVAPAPQKSVKEAKVSALCSEPKGEFGTCSFTCEGNPSGESKCRTDMKDVRCVRRVCNANGQWANPMNLPKSYGSFCEASQPVVRKDCNQQ